MIIERGWMARLLVVLAVSALLLQACTGRATDGSASRSPSQVTVAAASATPAISTNPTIPPTAAASDVPAISMPLPVGWMELSLTAESLQTLAAESATSNPAMSAQLDQLVSSGAYKAIRYYAVDNAGGAYHGNASVVAAGVTGADGLDEVRRGALDSLKSQGATGIVVTDAIVDGQGATLLEYDIAAPASATTSTAVHGKVFLLVKQGNLYAAGVTCEAASRECIESGERMILGMKIR